MATSLPVKRMTKERQELEKENPDYFVYFKDDNLLEFEAYVIGPDDTLYQHKLVKLRFKIPPRYPMVPPTVTFVQHSGGRIHPNLYVEGKVCLSILGTWAGEPWAFGMNCNTVLITIRSLLDNEPYKHEPHCGNNPEFNKFVEYSTWRCLLLDYIKNEAAGPAKEFLQKYLRERGSRMMDEIRRQQAANLKVKQFKSPYGSCTSSPKPDYAGLIKDLSALITAAPESSTSTSSSSTSTLPSGGIKRSLVSPHAPEDVQPTPDCQQRKRAKKDNPTQIIDLTDLTDSSDSESKKATDKTGVKYGA